MSDNDIVLVIDIDDDYKPMKRISQEFADTVIERMIMTARRSDVLTYGQVLLAVGLHQETDRQLCRFENYKETKNVCKQLIGTRREINGLHGKLDSSIVKKTMPVFDKDLADWELRVRGIDPTGTGTVVNVHVRGNESAQESIETRDEDA